ncbi:hypothetical protein ASF80_03310 [Microbacterium sp. Leaf159]|nr:hypothetical protein ASF80_03310 [Microbacterium sp. Leaf159]
MDAIYPELLDTSVSIFRCDADADVLRGFSATVRYTGDDDAEPREIGRLSGWLTREVYSDVADAGDALSADGMILGSAAQKLVDEHEGDRILDAVVMLDRATLEPEYRGQKLLGALVDDLLDVLQLEPTETIVVVFPESLPLVRGAPRPEGEERQVGLRKLSRALEASGFQQIDEEQPADDEAVTVWWRPFPD